MSRLIEAILTIIRALFSFSKIEKRVSKIDAIEDSADIKDESDIISVDSTNITIPVVTEVEISESKRYCWCLDNGHGRLQAGKRSPKWVDGDGEVQQFFEYEFNRDIVKRIAEKLYQLGIAYLITVPEIEVGSFLPERVERANEHQTKLQKIFVSVHANAAPARTSGWTNASGVETWHLHRSKNGQAIAGVFQKHISAATGWKDRKVKSRPTNQFYVLRKTRMPAVLTENGFYNNKQQVKELMKDEVRQKIADAHVAAILYIEKNF